jgi:hypothetical protein
VQLTNFNAAIKKTVVHDDGVETKRHYEIESTFKGCMEQHTVAVAEYPSMRWVAEKLPGGAAVLPGSGVVDQARYALLALSGDIPESVTHTRTGWLRLNDEWVYLHAGGGIDRLGARTDIATQLPHTLAAMKFIMPADDQALAQAVRVSLAFRNLGPSRVTIPLLSAAYCAAIEYGDFSIHLAGRTDSQKSELAARIQQHWGAQYQRLHLPGAWSSTANALETICFAAQDAPTVIDEYVAVGLSTYERALLQSKAERIFRAQGNQSGRQRLRADLTLRPNKPPRGLVISTGEDVPTGQSLRGRLFFAGAETG